MIKNNSFLNTPFKGLLRSAFLVLLVVIIHGCRNNNDQGNANRTNFDTETIKLSQSILKLSIKLNNTKLNPSIKLENFVTGKKISMVELLEKNKYLIFQYSELNCNTCIDSALNELKKIESDIGENHVLIIAASENRRYMANFIHINTLKGTNIYMITPAELESLYTTPPNAPFLYVSDKSLRVIDAFVPMKELPAMSITYYKEIFSKHFNNKANLNIE